MARTAPPERFRHTFGKLSENPPCRRLSQLARLHRTEMGGVWCKRAERPIQPFYQLVFYDETGKCHLNQYQNAFMTRLKGILADGWEIPHLGLANRPPSGLILKFPEWLS
ncbi:hypothetical protein [Celerinatantimonas diazotrophica]|uniref:hypothetical protein n=1 Tax=Celerinatantimonas diazotrophica TaxID=412034 RepID=UPI00104A107C|nr:hypothetical protein [Celerinatantimonas diazotrophica]